MKKTIATLCLVAATLVANAMSISITEHNDLHLRFDISGPLSGSAAVSEILSSTSARVSADQVGQDVVVDLVWFLPVGAYNDTFTLANGTLSDFGGFNFTESGGTYSFSYQAPFIVPELDTDPPWQVPDSGSSSVMLLIGLAILGVGCTRTTISRKSDGAWSIQRSSFLQKLEIPGASIATNGTWMLKGYSNDGGTAATAAIVEAAVAGAVKGAK